MAVCKEGVVFGSSILHKMVKQYDEMKKVGKHTNQGLREMAVEMYINQLLSGGKTMVVNPLSAVMKASQMAAERYSAAAVNKLMGREGVNWDDANRFIGTLLTEFEDVLKMFKHTMKSGKPAFEGTKIEEFGVTRAMTADNLERTPLKWMVNGDRARANINAIGALTNLPGRILMAQDDAMKAWVTNAERKYVAGIYARQQASSPMGYKVGTKEWQDDVDRIYNDLLQNPEKSDKLMRRTKEAGQESTFTTDYRRTSVMYGISKITKNFTPARLFFTFTKVPSNIVSEGVQMLPIFQFLSPNLIRKLISSDPLTRQIAHGKLLLSNTLAAGIVGLTVNETFMNLGGPGPLNAKLKADRFRMGKWPNALNFDLDGDGIFEAHFSYERFQPFAAILNNVAAFAEFYPYLTEGEYTEYAMSVTLTIMNNLTDHPMMTGITKIGDVIEAGRQGDEDKLKELLGEQLVTMTPIVGATGLKDITRAIDPQKRNVDSTAGFWASYLNRVKSRLPFVSRGLAPEYNMKGEPMEYTSGLMPDMFPNWLASIGDIFMPVKLRVDTPQWEFIRDQLLVNEVSFSAPSDKEFGFEFTPLEKSEFSRMLGQGIPPEKEGDPPQLVPLEQALMDLLTTSDEVKKGDPVKVRPGWLAAPAGQNAGAGSKQDRVSDLRSKRKRKIGQYMRNLVDDEGNPVYPGFAEKFDAWKTRRDGEMLAPTDVKRDGKAVPPPIF